MFYSLLRISRDLWVSTAIKAGLQRTKKKKNNNQSGSRKKGFWNECDKKKYSGDVAIKI